MIKKLINLKRFFLEKKSWWFFLGFLFLLVILLRDSFFGFILEFSLSKRYPDYKITFSKFSVIDAAIHFEDVEITTPQMELEAKEVALGLKFDLYHFQIYPKVKIIQPLVYTKENQHLDHKQGKGQGELKKDSLAKLMTNRIFLQIEEGFWNHADKKRCNFSITSQIERPEVKQIHLSLIESLDLDSKLKIHLQPYHHDFNVDAELLDFDMHWLSELHSLSNYLKQQGIEELSGKVSGKVHLSINRRFEMVSSDCDLKVCDLKVQTAQLESLQANHSKFQLNIFQNKNSITKNQPNWSVLGGVHFDLVQLKLDHYTMISSTGKLVFNQQSQNEVDIQGKIKIGKDEANFILKGKPKPVDSKDRDFIVDFLFTDERLSHSKAHFTFSSLKEDLFDIKVKIDQIPFYYISALQKTLDYYFPELNLFEIKQGDLTMEGNIHFHGYTLLAVEIGKIDAKNVKLQILDPPVECEFQKLEAGLDYHICDKKLKNWFVNAIQLKILYEDPLLGTFYFSEGEFKVKQELDHFSFSTVRGKLLEQPFKLEFFGPKFQPDLALTWSITNKEILQKFQLKSDQVTNFTLPIQVTNERHEDYWSLAFILGEKNKSYLCADGKLYHYDLKEISTKEGIRQLLKGVRETQIHGKKVHHDLYGIILKSLKLPWRLKGDIDCEGDFEEGVLNLSLSFDHLDLDSDEIYYQQQLRSKESSPTQGFLQYHCLTEKLKLFVPLDHGNCLHKESNLWFEDAVGYLKIVDNVLKIDQLSLTCENLRLKGKLLLEFLEDKPYRLDLSVEDVQGKVLNLQRLARHFPEFSHLNFPFDGDLFPLEDPFALQMVLYPSPQLPKWHLNAKIKNGEFFDLNLLEIQGVEFDLKIGSHKEEMEIINFYSSLAFNGISLPYHLTSPLLTLQMQKDLRASFHLYLETEFLEIGSIEGSLIANGSNFLLDLEPNRFIKEWSSFVKENDEWVKGGVLIHLEKGELENVLKRFSTLSKDAHLILSGVLNETQNLEGIDFSIQVTQAHEIRLVAISQEKYPQELIQIETLFKDGILNVKKAKLKDFISNFEIEFSDQNCKMKSFEMVFQDYHLALSEGGYDFVDSTGKIQLNKFKTTSIKKLLQYLPFLDQNFDGEVFITGQILLNKESYQLEVKKIELENCSKIQQIEIDRPFFINFDVNQGIFITQLDMKIKDDSDVHDYFSLKSDLIVLDPRFKSIESESIKIKISPELIRKIPSFLSEDLASNLQNQVSRIHQWDNLLQIDIKLKSDQKNVICQGVIEDGYYWIDKYPCYFEKVKFEFKNFHLGIEGISKVLDFKLGFFSEIDLAERSNFVVDLYHVAHPQEKGKLIFAIKDQNLELINCYGSFLGVKFDLLPQKLNCFPGEAIFTVGLEIDPKSIMSFLPKEMIDELKPFKINKKVFLKGNLLLDFYTMKNSYFKGFITSKNIELQDVVIENIQCLVTYDHSNVKIENFSLADAAILMKFEQMQVSLETDSWMNFSVKNILVNDFRPSLMTKVQQPKGKIKPFLIRNLKIEELKGNLTKADEIKGKGVLQFINTFKRENHLIDIPIEFISRLGLDIGLLIPVRGEIDIEIKEKKIWLKELKNSYSDGKRSHFYFPSGKPCYVDFDGNMHIDVKMKQFVLFKITQPFTLSLRGTLENPSFSLK